MHQHMGYQPTLLATAAPSRSQRAVAVLLAALVIIVTVVFWEHAADAGPQLPVLVGGYQTAVVFCDFLTAVLLFIQFSQLRSADLLLLSCGYLFTSLVVSVHLASFPEVFATQGVIGGGSQTTPWLWNFWHCVFPLTVLLYAVSRGQIRANVQYTIACAVLLTILAAGLAVLYSAHYASFAPPLIEGLHFTPFYERNVYPIIVATSMVAMAALLVKKPQSTVSLFLSLSMLAFFLDVVNNCHSGARYSMGWYIGRANGLLASISLSVVFVIENAYLLHYGNRAAEQLAAFNVSLQAANESKSRFFAAASHDLRQPFQAMRLFYSVLEGTALADNQRQPLARLGQAMTSAQTLLDALLDAARLQSGTVTVRPQPVELADVIAELNAELGPIAAQKGLKMRTRAAPAMVSTDPLLLKRVLTNLVTNAIRYTQRGGVLIGLRRRDKRKRVIVEVWDTGIGISEKEVAHIFEEFYQVGNSSRDRSLGLGLGLPIVKGLCDTLGYEVTMASHLGKGSVFRVAIPFA